MSFRHPPTPLPTPSRESLVADFTVADLALLAMLSKGEEVASIAVPDPDPAEMPVSWRWNPNKARDSNNGDDDESWEVKAFAEDTGSIMGATWPPRSYTCTFCRREFRSAQALGGHMNVHRRDRARLNQQRRLLLPYPYRGPLLPPCSSSSSSSSSTSSASPPSSNGGVHLVDQLPCRNGNQLNPVRPTFISIPAFASDAVPYPGRQSYPRANVDRPTHRISHEEDPHTFKSTDSKDDGANVELDLELRLGM